MTRYIDLVKLAADNIDGNDWYDCAKREIETVCNAESWNIEYFTGILAVTSPRVSVKRNIRITLNYMGGNGLMTNIIRSVKRSVEVYNEDRTINGRKTEPFYRALRGDSSAIVLDTHMSNMFKVPQKLFALKTGYAYYAGIVDGIARELCISPAGCQACLWYGHRRALGEQPAKFPILVEYANWLSQGRQFPNSGSVDYKTDIAYPLFNEDSSFEFGNNVA